MYMNGVAQESQWSKNFGINCEWLFYPTWNNELRTVAYHGSTYDGIIRVDDCDIASLHQPIGSPDWNSLFIPQRSAVMSRFWFLLWWEELSPLQPVAAPVSCSVSWSLVSTGSNSRNIDNNGIEIPEVWILVIKNTPGDWNSCRLQRRHFLTELKGSKSTNHGWDSWYKWWSIISQAYC